MYLVTGSAGFIGFHTCLKLLNENKKVLGIDNFDDYYDRSTKEYNLESLLTKPNFVFVHMLLPHPPYIFGPNGEHVTPGNSLSGENWDNRDAHIDQIKFANKDF